MSRPPVDAYYMAPCKCGAKARKRYKIPVTWIECNKKCGMMTGFYVDGYEQMDPEAERKAVMEWNRLVKNTTGSVGDG